MSKFQPKKTNNVFEQDAPDTSLTAVDAKLYGKVDTVPSSGKVVIRPIDIMTIWADLTQPRRAIPLSVRGNWDGNPNRTLDVLVKWRQTAERLLDTKIDVSGILQGREQGEDGLIIPEGKAVAEAFIELLRLGASIHAEGLTNAITIAPRGERFLIETGERRWLAHHLLNEFVDGKFGKILTREVTYDRFRQASENNNRRKLTAIEMARQLALLLMDMYEGNKDVHFDSIEALTFNDCDRRFYAQVAHGRVWKIKDGFGERVQAAMGLPSLDRVADYRKLLRPTDDEELNDQIWMQADEENWTQNRIYEYVEGLKKPQGVGGDSNTPDENTCTPVHVSGDSAADSNSQNDTNPDQSAWASSAWVQRWAIVGASSFVWVIEATGPQTVRVIKGDGNTIDKDAEPRPLHIVALRAPEATTRTPAGTESDSKAQPKDLTSKAVQTVVGAIGIVQWDANGRVNLRFPDGTTAIMERQFVSYVPMTEWDDAVKRHNALKNSGKPATGATATTPAATTGTPGRELTTAQLVGKPVLYNGIAAFVKATSGSESVLIKIGRDERIVHKDSLTLNPTAPEQTLKDYIEQSELAGSDDADYNDEDLSDDFIDDELTEGGEETAEFEPFNTADHEVLQHIADAADLLDIGEAVVIEDLLRLSRADVERIAREDGMTVIEQMADIYRMNAANALERIMQRIEAYVDGAVAVAREIVDSSTEGK